MKQNPDRDFTNYDSTIANIHGTLPYNGYLWPTEQWRAPRQFDSRWSIEIVALKDGRYATDGAYWIIMQQDAANPEYTNRLRLAYPTRTAAIRTSAARLIQQMRASRRWGPCTGYGGMTGSKLAACINWVRQTVAIQTQTPTPADIRIKDPPPKPTPTGLEGLPLFDHPSNPSDTSNNNTQNTQKKGTHHEYR